MNKLDGSLFDSTKVLGNCLIRLKAKQTRSNFSLSDTTDNAL